LRYNILIAEDNLKFITTATAAAAIGILAGDRIESINGTTMTGKLIPRTIAGSGAIGYCRKRMT